MVTIVIATSYVTLGIFAPDTAKQLWWAYAAVTFALALVNIVMENNACADINKWRRPHRKHTNGAGA